MISLFYHGCILIAQAELDGCCSLFLQYYLTIGWWHTVFALSIRHWSAWGRIILLYRAVHAAAPVHYFARAAATCMTTGWSSPSSPQPAHTLLIGWPWAPAANLQRPTEPTFSSACGRYIQQLDTTARHYSQLNLQTPVLCLHVSVHDHLVQHYNSYSVSTAQAEAGQNVPISVASLCRFLFKYSRRADDGVVNPSLQHW